MIPLAVSLSHERRLGAGVVSSAAWSPNTSWLISWSASSFGSKGDEGGVDVSDGGSGSDGGGGDTTGGAIVICEVRVSKDSNDVLALKRDFWNDSKWLLPLDRIDGGQKSYAEKGLGEQEGFTNKKIHKILS